MAAFETTPVAIFQADQPTTTTTIVQRFLATSERCLFPPPAAACLHLREPGRGLEALHDECRLCLSLPRCSQPCEQARAAA